MNELETKIQELTEKVKELEEKVNQSVGWKVSGKEALDLENKRIKALEDRLEENLKIIEKGRSSLDIMKNISDVDKRFKYFEERVRNLEKKTIGKTPEIRVEELSDELKKMKGEKPVSEILEEDLKKEINILKAQRKEFQERIDKKVSKLEEIVSRIVSKRIDEFREEVDKSKKAQDSLAWEVTGEISSFKNKFQDLEEKIESADFKELKDTIKELENYIRGLEEKSKYLPVIIE